MNQGCFHGLENKYVIRKGFFGACKMTAFIDTKNYSRKISTKQVQAFLDNFTASITHFNEDINQSCTSTSEYYLEIGTEKLNFTNVTCEQEFNPENLLSDLIRKQ